jgi:hypothetical protein
VALYQLIVHWEFNSKYLNKNSFIFSIKQAFKEGAKLYGWVTQD